MNALARKQFSLGVLYLVFIAVVVGLLTYSLSKVRPGGGYAYPPGFKQFRNLFYFQFGLFGGAILATLIYLSARAGLPFLVRAIVFGLFHFLFVWQLFWNLVQRSFGIELTPQIVLDLFLDPASIEGVGLQKWEFASVVGIALAITAGLTALSLSLTKRSEPWLRRWGCIVLCGLFLLFHIPVRAYFVYHINRNSPVVLAYDDCAPLSPRSEHLIPGLRSARMALPNFESENLTAQYFNHLSALSMPEIPRPRNILWINVESLRFDAINEQVMPRLWAYRDRFQIQLDRQHWSGGNSSQFGLFSMLTGLSGYHFNRMRRARTADPFLNLLAKNGYRLRVAKKSYIRYLGPEFWPSSTVYADINIRPHNEADRSMVDNFLMEQRERDPAATHFDFVPFDAPHWPYWFPIDHAIFQPAPPVTTSTHIRRSAGDLAHVWNRYRNACHFVDEQIARVLDELQARGGFDNTIVIVLGDHGEEFQERGQMAHSAALNDFQGRPVLWMHFPDGQPSPRIEGLTIHLDIVPTLLEALGFREDLLYTQGRSLLSKLEERPMLSICEQGFSVPLYRALVTRTHISRWSRRPRRYLFSGVQRRDGSPVRGEDWAREARDFHPSAAQMYEVLPDVSKPPRKFLPPAN